MTTIALIIAFLLLAAAVAAAWWRIVRGRRARARTNPRLPLRRAPRDAGTSASNRVKHARNDDGSAVLTGVIVGSMLFGESHAEPPADSGDAPDSGAPDAGGDSGGSIGGASDGGFDTGGDF
jgi:hypothetical protein